MIDSILKNRVYILLALIFLVAGVLRFYKIDQVPVSLYWDEVSQAYNAYSVLENGRDEFGNQFPLLFRAFEDYKTPGNIYLTAISIKAFGLNEFAVRFPSAFLGTLSVLIVFFLVRELVKSKKHEIEVDIIALITTALVAISPWHIQFSRTGFEANTGLFFVILGAYLLFKFFSTESYKLLYLSLASYAVSIYFYRSIWIFVPMFLIFIFLLYYKILFSKKNIKKTIIGILLFTFIVFPFVTAMISSKGLTRANQVTIVSNSQDKVYDYALKQENSGPLGKIIYNRRIVYASEFVKGYTDHFSLNFLFLEGDRNGRHGVRDVGVLYVWAILFIIPGVIMLTKLDRERRWAIIIWLILAPLPAAISVPAPHALRSLNMIPIPQLIIALGITWVFLRVKKNRIFFSAFIIGMILYFFVSYSTSYFNDNAIKTSSEWGDGYKQLVSFTQKNENKYDKFVISGHYWQPYIYFLFYTKHDPKNFQSEGKKSGFDKYIFGGTSWDMQGKELGDQDLEKLAGTQNYIVALSPSEYKLQKNNLKVVNRIKNHNNELVFIIATPKK